MTERIAHADLIALQNTAQHIAAQADQILLQGYGKVTAARKSDGTLVTQTDRAVDTFITAQLKSAYPDHAVLSEESNTTYDPGAAFTWVIDPLDGTTNFARGLPVWGVSLALLSSGTPCLGLLSFVSLHEQYTALAGHGAKLNGAPIHTARESVMDDQHFLMMCTRTPRRYRVNTPLKPRILGSAAYHVAAVANGSALAGIEATPKLWDIAAALLILVEAGGVFRQLDSSAPPFPLPTATTDYADKSFPLLAAANSAILAEMEPSIVAI